MFTEMLKRAGINKTELSRRLGLDKHTVYVWREEAPQYAKAYLELLIEYNRYRP